MTDMKMLVIANPAAGGGRCGRELPRLRRALEATGVEFSILLTSKSGDAEEMARNAAGRYATVACAGGDGTISEIAQVLVGTEIALGVLSLGTGNDFAKMMDLPFGINGTKGLEAQVDVLIKGSVRPFDVGRINDRYFVNVVGIGFDAAVNHEHHRVTWLNGVSSYMYALAKTVFRYTPSEMSIEVSGPDGKPGESFKQDVYVLTVGNGHTCGGIFKFTPDASVEDGELDLSVIDPIGKLKLLWNLPRLFTGTIHDAGFSFTKRFGSLRVTSDSPLPVHIDGEMYITDRLEHEITVVPGALKVICGRPAWKKVG